ncbi:MAG: adaptor protein MecA [Lachnospiraceae bacterium]|nr:adaptor protein MecA [Lachnospiraceae bacterium]
MKFERVDGKTVRCFISNEELEGYQIDYKDFVMRSEKAREVVRSIIEQAAEEVGYKPPKFAFDMSIMMMPEQGLVLTFSESDPLEDSKAGGKLMEYLNEMKKALEQAADEQQVPEEKKEAKKNAPLEKQPDRGIFEFDCIGTVMELAAALPKNLRVQSELYRMDGKYYLYIQKGTASYQRYNKACVQAIEFASLYGADDQKYLFLLEHGTCLIAEKALNKLHVDHRKKTAAKEK